MPKPRKNSDSGSGPPFNPAALRALMEHTLGGLGPSKRNDEQRAQDLVYDAMEASTWERRLRLVRQALALDPENVDALLMVAEASDLEGVERIEALRGIVAAGAKRLGKKAFKELVPHFWGFIETRPYMRARERLATALREAGRLDEAAAEYAEMLALNENDNQGVRYELLPVLLSQGRLDEARALMERYKDDCEWNVVFAWRRVLERLLSKDEAGAVKALAVARKQNAHMEAHLKGQRKLPKNLPGSYSPGSKEEALCYAGALMAAWKAHPAALALLASQSIVSMKSMAGMDRVDTMDGMDTHGEKLNPWNPNRSSRSTAATGS
jgi:tetratricopeptide (TPR) repeat protein